MLKTLKYKLLVIVMALSVSVPVLIPIGASATCSGTLASNINTGINVTTGGTTGGGCNAASSLTGGVKSIAKKVIDLFSIIVGIVSVVMIIYAGFRYVTSGGESGSVSSAKNTLIYAIIGLVIVVLAQLIVRYVLRDANSIGSTSTGL